MNYHIKRYFFKFKKAIHLLGCKIYRLNLIKGVAASIEHASIIELLISSDIKTVIDIGANKGQFSITARKYFPGAHIIAFEPINKPAMKYRSIFKDDSQTRLVEAAIGPKNEFLEMHISKAVDSSSLLPIGPKQVAIYPGTEETHKETVEVGPLESFISSSELNGACLLKIDVQGYELKVLTGCENLINKFNAIYIECSFVELYEGQALAHEIINWLHEHDFQLKRIANVSFDKKGLSVQSDFLFLKNTY
ncbi:MAG: FkbM family methyltransferase [Candidatus Electrothrix sp. AR5]|nr:FkbM family methyltransferase [Candidatus Electrothrix sp. AR5]